jgi:hypothetical protein
VNKWFRVEKFIVEEDGVLVVFVIERRVEKFCD